MGRRQARRKKRRAERERCVPRLDKLIIDQANFDGSWRRTQALMSYERQGRNGGSADIICGCDPSPRTIWRTCLHYCLEMNPARPLIPTDNPDDPSRRIGHGNKNKSSQAPEQEQPAPVKYGRVFFFVHRSIPRELWHVKYHDGPNHDMAATLFLQTQQGEIAIHSLYNVNQPAKDGRPKRNINVEVLVRDTTSHGFDIVRNHTTAAKVLEDEMITKANMVLLTKQGTVTCSRGKGDDHPTASCIDLTFVSSALYPKVKHWGVFQDNPWKLSDHRPIRTILDMSAYRDDSEVLLWNRTNSKAFLEAVGQGLRDLNDMALDSRQDSDAFALKLIQVITSLHRNMSKVVSEIHHHDNSPWILACGTSFRLNASRLPRAQTFNLMTTQILRTAMSKRLIAKTFRPRNVINVPALVHGGTTFASEKEKQKCIRDFTWTETSESGPPRLPFPDLSPDREEFEMDLVLTELEIISMIQRLPSKKACGEDKVPNEALKLCRELVAPYIAKLFNACIRLGYHAVSFRKAVTVMLPKADHKLLPETQYGAPGRSTTDALKAMLGVVRKAWAWKPQNGKPQLYVSMVALDVSGAYNCVDRILLLQTLAGCGVATWFLRVIHSFLSDRATVLKLPQSVSDPFFVNIGIPQGSPTIPPALPKMKRPYVEVHVFSYVDDTYLMAVSPSYEENCAVLKVFHDLIMEWAKGAHLSFSPEKSLVIHFQRPVSMAKQKSDQRKRENLGPNDMPREKPKVEPPCTLLPDIDELKNNPNCLQHERLLVLGLMLDPKLSFEHHLTLIEEKVETALRYQLRISGANWGMTLEKTRQYYICKIRPVISYACAAWFVWVKKGGLHCSLPDGQIARLQKLQYKCIMLLSGAIRGTARVVLEKECHIDSIEVFLYRMSISFRAKSLTVRPYAFWFDKEPQHYEDGKLHGKGDKYNNSAFDILNHKARLLVKEAGERFRATWKGPKETTVLEAWRNPVNRNKAIRQRAILQAAEASTEIWNAYLKDRRSRQITAYRPLALTEGWGRESLAYYQGMTRPESTLGMQLRTECVGLNWYLNKCHVLRDVKLPSSNAVVRVRVEATCTCGYPNQTVYHMFMECPDLHDARLLLIRKVKHFRWETLLTTDLKIAVHWAMMYFRLEQFWIARLDSMFYVKAGGS
ncbi:Reverse transcriptase domain [Fusarium oxysporum f. sp. vasinfectum]|nr:Reverse transcriptase domain [Fusarium oxysporum f. sp. vasinfectum]